MKHLLLFFDYIFFRIYLYFKKKNDDISYEKAINFVALMQCFIIIDLLMIIKYIISFEIDKQYYNKWLWGLPLILIIGIYNHIRYRHIKKNNNYSNFYCLWSEEKYIIKKRNGWLIVLLTTIIIIIIPAFYIIFN